MDRPRVSLSLKEARALAVAAQGFGRRPVRPGPARLAGLLAKLGAVQLDSVNILARSHELALYSRLGPYRPADLHRVAYRRRVVFEYWGHAASWLPMAEYRWFLPRMLAHREKPRGWWADVRERHGHLAQAILERIRAQGPLMAADFTNGGRTSLRSGRDEPGLCYTGASPQTPPTGGPPASAAPDGAALDDRAGRGSWWDWKPAKLVLEDLFDQGILMVADRRAGFQRVYDLAERVLPPDVDTRPPTADEAAQHLLARAARALGVASARDLADYFRVPPPLAKPALRTLLEAGRLVPAALEGWRQPAYLPPEALAGRPRRPCHPPLFLSPFDSLIWTRDRTARLFGFDFALEIYTPEAKRRYGYYVLPLLVEGRLVGRADVKHDRPAATLVVATAHLEPGCPEGTHEAMGHALADLARFLGATRLRIDRTDPPRALTPLRRAAAPAGALPR